MVLAPPGRGLQFAQQERQPRLNQSISVYLESNGQMLAYVSTLVKAYIQFHSLDTSGCWKQQKGSPL